MANRFEVLDNSSGQDSPTPEAKNRFAPLDEKKTAEPSKEKPRSLGERALEGAGWAGALTAVGKGMQVGAPVIGPVVGAGLAPFTEGASLAAIPEITAGTRGLGTILSATPIANMVAGAGSATAGELTRRGAKAVGVGQKGSDIAGTVAEFATPYGMQKAGRGLFEGLIGSAEENAQELVQRAKSLFPDLKLETGMIRNKGKVLPTEDVQKGNIAPANKYATAPTGKTSEKVDKEFFKDRRKYFKEQYDKIYAKDNIFTIPPEHTKKIVSMLKAELRADSAASSSSVKSVMRALLSPQDYKFVESLVNTQGKYGEAAMEQIENQVFGNRTLTLTGENMHKLRYELGRVADGDNAMDAKAARDMLNTVTRALQSTDPKLAALMAKTNKEYRPYATLRDMARTGEIAHPSGNVDLEALGNRLAKDDAMNFTGESNHPLHDLGEVGRAFGMKHYEGYGAVEPKMPAAIKKLFAKYGVPLGVAGGVGTLGEKLGAMTGIPGLGAAGATVGGMVGGGIGAGVDWAARNAPGKAIQKFASPEMLKPTRFPWEAAGGGVIANRDNLSDIISSPAQNR